MNDSESMIKELVKATGWLVGELDYDCTNWKATKEIRQDFVTVVEKAVKYINEINCMRTQPTTVNNPDNEAMPREIWALNNRVDNHFAENDAFESTKYVRSDIHAQALKALECAHQALEVAQEGLDRVNDWAKAYPLDIFPEPDFKKARELLEAGGMTIDSISASNMRHVVTRVAEIAQNTLQTLNSIGK